MAQTELVRVVAYLEPGLAERLSAAAAADDRSVSREIARRLEASFGKHPLTDAEREGFRRTLKESEPRVPPETPEPRAEVVERIQQQVPGVKTASRAFPSVPQDLARQVTPRPRGGS